MKNKIFPCLWFDGQAKAAADLYCAVFANSKITVDTPMVVNFELAGQKFMGLNGGPHFKINPSISFYVVCETEAEIDAAWAKLIEGGFAMMPLNTYPWSAKYGWLQDQFGVSWQLTLGSVQEIGQKITPTMMFVGQQHGKAEQAIAFYTSLFQNASTRMIARYEEGDNDVTGTIKHAQFLLENQVFAAMDSGMQHLFGFNEAVSFVVDCENQAETDYFWDKFTEGGEESQCAWLKDQFGVSWQIVPRQLMQLMSDPDREKAGRVMQAMMKMRKIIVSDLEKAYHG
jgi:predicted 3-demethylubiquinone-9 3-methyltransferase (glyoxalase superfamily)